MAALRGDNEAQHMHDMESFDCRGGTKASSRNEEDVTPESTETTERKSQEVNRATAALLLLLLCMI